MDDKKKSDRAIQASEENSLREAQRLSEQAYASLAPTTMDNHRDAPPRQGGIEMLIELRKAKQLAANPNRLDDLRRRADDSEPRGR